MIVKKSFLKKIYFILILCFLNFKIGYTQDYYQKFDEIIGLENREVFNGVLYKNKILFLKNSHPFFLKNQFTVGKIIYKNQPYQIKIKYDILNDIVLTTYTNNNISYPILINSQFIKEFHVDAYKFVKLTNKEFLEANNYKEGFFEEKFKKEDLALYIKHYARLKENKTGSIVKYGVKRYKTYIIQYHKKYLLVKKTRNLISFFPEYKKEIKAFFNNREINEKSLTNFIKNIKIN